MQHAVFWIPTNRKPIFHAVFWIPENKKIYFLAVSWIIQTLFPCSVLDSSEFICLLSFQTVVPDQERGMGIRLRSSLRPNKKHLFSVFFFYVCFFLVDCMNYSNK